LRDIIESARVCRYGAGLDLRGAGRSGATLMKKPTVIESFKSW
jgi:hypothetical protein